jgi:NADH:ubiquinone oxidoreductase subunit H
MVVNKWVLSIRKTCESQTVIKQSLIFLVFWIGVFIGILVCIPFLTLFERKILSYVQNRKGPKKVGFLGLLQPILDGVKLLIKDSCYPIFSNFLLFWGRRFLGFILMFLSWFFMPFHFSGYILNLGVLGFLCVLSFKVYCVIGSGWRGKSKYSLLGCVRGGVQVISYEVSMIFLIFFPLILLFSLKYWDFLYKRSFFFLVFVV